MCQRRRPTHQSRARHENPEQRGDRDSSSPQRQTPNDLLFLSPVFLMEVIARTAGLIALFAFGVRPKYVQSSRGYGLF